jgi:hypothetical protein
VVAAQQMMEWLLAGPVRLPSGAYLSWTDCEGTGFLYPETAAVAIRAACWWSRASGDRETLLPTIPTLAYLVESVNGADLIQHRGCHWLFDSLLAICAFESANRVGLPYSTSGVVPRLSAACTRMIDEECAVRPGGEARWSTRFSPHLLKPAALILTLDMGSEELRVALRKALPKLISYQDEDGAFRHPQMPRVYLHAHCYALEGLTILGSSSSQLQLGLAYLASQRRPDGGFGRWSDTPSTVAADVTAQAGRLFLLSNDQESAAMAQAALKQLTASSGALQYHLGSDHENSWATAFGAQLDHGLRDGLSPSDLV